MNVRRNFIILSVGLTFLIVLLIGSIPQFWWIALIFAPLILLGYYDIIQKKQAIKRNFPVIGHGRYLLEKIRPEIMQYFVETNTEGKPFNRIHRSLVYQRSKKVTDTNPFGTQLDVYQIGYEWMEHSIYSKCYENLDIRPRVIIGGADCKKPYSSSLLNISAMSFGALSQNAILSLNKGAKMDNFAHNTGEGGLSIYHKEPGGDLIWQIGTGYFGCRDLKGNFDPVLFKENASFESVKMIEIKLSQGAKPGHGGILPASKNTPEIAKIRGVTPHTTVYSPPCHSTFSNPKEFVLFIDRLRKLAMGKPVGFKLCVGRKDEFIDICKAIVETGIKPDFITVDGGEGGTGAAPVEFSNSLGMPLREALSFVYNTLIGFNIKREIKIIASSKILTGFHMARAFALGADLCNSARGMMLSLGCIQALNCNKNTCPVGVATQDKSLMKGLNVEDKSERVANYHHSTIHSFMELIAAAGLTNPNDIMPAHINRRVSMSRIMKYDELYPTVEAGCLIDV